LIVYRYLNDYVVIFPIFVLTILLKYKFGKIFDLPIIDCVRMILAGRLPVKNAALHPTCETQTFSEKERWRLWAGHAQGDCAAWDSLSGPLVPVGLVFCAGGGFHPPSAAAEPAPLFLRPLRD
jgi:hypothetical protein